jgi:anti-anti-sigma factor
MLKLQGGDYDVGRKDDLRAEVAGIPSSEDIVLDLSTTNSVDCSCIGVLIAQLRAWRAKFPDRTFRLQNVAPGIARMIALLNLERLFLIESLRSGQ